MYNAGLVDRLTRYEAGEMDGAEEEALFLELIESRLVWKLQGHYGRRAMGLIEDRRAEGKDTPGASNTSNVEKASPYTPKRGD